MKPSNDAARIYAALALRAAGRPVDHRSVAEICDFLGLPDDRQGVTALLHLLAVEREERSSAPSPSETAPGGDVAAAVFSALGTTRTSDPAPPGWDEPRQSFQDTHPDSGTAAATEDWAHGMATPPDPPPEIEEAFYVYGIVKGEPPEDRDLAGIEGRRVEAISFGDTTALGHPCPAVPYSASDAEIMIGWIEEHDAVLRKALTTYAAVVPCKFNTMVKLDDRPAGVAVRDWLEELHDELGTLFARVRGRIEYGLRVLWQPASEPDVAPELPAQDAANAGAPLPPGVQYLLQEQLKRHSAESHRQAQADIRARCLTAITPLTDGIVEQRRDGTEEEDRTVLRCACLVPVEMSASFFDVLERLKMSEHVAVQVTGPWPAYSFVTDRALGAAAP